MAMVNVEKTRFLREALRSGEFYCMSEGQGTYVGTLHEIKLQFYTFLFFFSSPNDENSS